MGFIVEKLEFGTKQLSPAKKGLGRKQWAEDSFTCPPMQHLPRDAVCRISLLNTFHFQ